MTTLDKQQLDIFRRLISFETVSDHSNLRLINYVEELVEGTGAKITKQFNEKGDKANLLITIGPENEPGGIIFSGHTDVVPAGSKNWYLKQHPFTLTEYNDAFYARGAVDMKGFNALALSQLINTAEQQHRLTRPLSLLLTYDEEIGCFGVRNFLAAHKKELGTPDLILVSEPTELKPVLAHKGCHCYEVNIWGKNAHSSNPNKGVNAVEYASIAISRLLELNRVTDLNDLRRRDDPESEAYRILDDRFDPPHSTINIGTIKGGEAINITAHHCRFTFETRPIPDDDGTIVGRDLDDILNSREFYTHGDNGYDHESFEFEVSEYISNPPFEGDPEAPGTKFLLKHLDDPTPLAVPFMTEASALSNAGFNTVVCGPGSIEQAHQLNEFITRDQLERGAKLLERLTERCFEPV